MVEGSYRFGKGEESNYPRTVFPAFPLPPYEVQKELMSELYKVCKEGGVGIFESPTGTGKSLSVICSTLQWRADEEASRRLDLMVSDDHGSNKLEERHGDSTTMLSSSSTLSPRFEEPDWLRDWDRKQQKKEDQILLQRLEGAEKRLARRLENAFSPDSIKAHSSVIRDNLRWVDARKWGKNRDRKFPSVKIYDRGGNTHIHNDNDADANIVDDYYSDDERKRRGHINGNGFDSCLGKKRKRQTTVLFDSSSSEESDSVDTVSRATAIRKRKKESEDIRCSIDCITKDGAAKILKARTGANSWQQQWEQEQDQDEEDQAILRKLIPKVYYCSRTHSQLAQFVREVRKVNYLM